MIDFFFWQWVRPLTGLVIMSLGMTLIVVFYRDVVFMTRGMLERLRLWNM